jgi:hypothetical protein
MKFLATALVAAAGVFLFWPTTGATAEELTFRFRNDHKNIVNVELYSDDRNHVWPGNNEVYTLTDGRPKDVHIACQRGEKICYGAWVKGTESASWGTGRGGKGECKSCCYSCDGGETPILVLD